jgi:hypothetical protein
VRGSPERQRTAPGQKIEIGGHAVDRGHDSRTLEIETGNFKRRVPRVKLRLGDIDRFDNP